MSSKDLPKKFTLNYGDQGTLSEGLFDDIGSVLEKYSDVMTLAGIIGVLEAVKFDLFLTSLTSVDDDDEGDEDDDDWPNQTVAFSCWQ